ncbi:MAG: response regulator [Rhodocyclaceae bacterium]|nr:response regulator [Rhodocyclaceae bacterium]
MKRLMIVDDSNIIRSKIARALGEHGLEVVGLSPNGEDAIERCVSARPDVITMDITMPGMDGIECIRQIRRLNPTVRILVVSALADKATAIQALKEGAQGFVCKPFTEESLNEAIGELFSED